MGWKECAQVDEKLKFIALKKIFVKITWRRRNLQSIKLSGFAGYYYFMPPSLTF
jgi:hypothetical protein